MSFAFCGGRIFTGDGIESGLAVIVDGSAISDVVTETGLPASMDRVELNGGLLAPGFVDVQVNGGGGVLLNETPTLEGVRAIASAHWRFGTTSMIPTMVSDDWATMVAVGDAVAAALNAGVPGVRGVHFEGPYLNVARKGVHLEDKIRALDEDAFALFTRSDLGTVVVTLAPEMVPAGTVAQLAKAGVRVCAGHTAARYDDVRRAIGEGLSGFTHLFNAMSPYTSREPGVVGAALEDDSTWCGLIVDGYHVHPATMRVAHAAKAPGLMMLVSDAMPSVGADKKTFTLAGETIKAVDGRCALADGTLAGSDLDMASAVRNTVSMLQVPLTEALNMASLYPARFLGLDGAIGRIAAGLAADLVVLNDALTVEQTWIGGRRVMPSG